MSGQFNVNTPFSNPFSAGITFTPGTTITAAVIGNVYTAPVAVPLGIGNNTPFQITKATLMLRAASGTNVFGTTILMLFNALAGGTYAANAPPIFSTADVENLLSAANTSNISLQNALNYYLSTLIQTGYGLTDGGGNIQAMTLSNTAGPSLNPPGLCVLEVQGFY